MTKQSSENNNEINDVDALKKGHATPTRKEREAANKRPLVPGDRKEAARVSRERMAEQRNKARVGLAAGDERYLPVRDRGPQKRYARDYVDARYNVGELMVPFMLLVIVMTFLPDIAIQESSFVVLWTFFFIAVGDAFLMSRKLSRLLQAKFGSVEKGVKWYASMRTLQMRPMRLPKPQVARRQFPQ